jgi:hypothetical protein
MKYSLLSLVLCCFLFLVSCSKEENPVKPQPVDSDMLVVSETTDNGIKMQLFANDSLEPGYNKLYLKLTKVSTGEIIRNANVSVKAIAADGMDSKSTVVEQPGTTASGDVFAFAAVFFEYGPWTLDVDVKSTSGEALASAELPAFANYVEYGYGRIAAMLGPGGKTYILSIQNMSRAVVGVNDVEFTVHSTSDLENYSPVENATFVMNPTLESTGQVSSNNVTPVHIGAGHYKGKVNFTAKGDWKVIVDMKLGTETVISADFPVTL